MRTLVTGGAGYIGSHLCVFLLANGHAVTAVDDLSTGHEDAVDWKHLVKSSIASAETSTRLSYTDAVFHLAASSVVGDSIRNALAYYVNNVEATIRLLVQIEVRRSGGPFIVFASTAADGSPYARSKRMVEDILRDAWIAYGLPSVSLRYFNVAGSAHGLRERHQPETHLIPNLLDAACTGQQVTIYGDDYDTPDGTAIRDYVHVEDVCRANLAAAELLKHAPGCYVFEVGSGIGYSVMQVVRAAQDATGREIQTVMADRRAGDAARLVADPTALMTATGWGPRYDLTAIIKSAWAARKLSR